MGDENLYIVLLSPSFYKNKCQANDVAVEKESDFMRAFIQDEIDETK